MNKKVLNLLLITTIALTGCATSSKNIETKIIPPSRYKDWSCSRIERNIERRLATINQVGKQMDKKSEHDTKAVAMAPLHLVGAVVGSPWLIPFNVLSAFGQHGKNKQQEEDYATLKGEHEALQNLWNIKCVK